jgi:hypothetical protein
MLLQDNEEIPDEVMVRAKKEKEKKRRLSSSRRSSRKSETSRLGRADDVFTVATINLYKLRNIRIVKLVLYL